MVFPTAMETRNGSHYCYGDKEWVTQLLWRKGKVFTTAMKTRNGLHYCYGGEEWISLQCNRFCAPVYVDFVHRLIALFLPTSQIAPDSHGTTGNLARGKKGPIL